MRQCGGFRAFAIITLAITAVGPQAVAQSPAPNSSPPAKQAQSPSEDDVPPFLHARAWGGQHLDLAISGLKSGLARVEAGDRPFGVCWNGGSEPYEVTLRNSAGEILVDESKIAGDELIRSSGPIRFEPGVYTLDVADSAGNRATGRFTVVASASWPSEKRWLSRPGATHQADINYSYEAYLNALVQDGDPRIATEHAAQNCHRLY